MTHAMTIAGADARTPASTANPVPVTLASGSTDQDVNLVQVGGAAVTAGAGAVASGTPRVTLASDDPAVAKLTNPATGTITSVNDTNASATILASNASRKGAAVFNDSTVLLYLALSDTTASATVYTVQVPAGGFYELPFAQGGIYTGKIVGIWASDASGAARVTELT